MKVAALIPARTGSRGIPGKNFRKLDGVTLWKRSLCVARDALLFDNIIISSDGGLDSDKGADGITFDNDRPANLSTDKATLDDLLIHYAIRHPEIEAWCLLQPTSPLRTAEDIKASYAMLAEKTKDGGPKYDSVVSVYNHPIIGWVANSAFHKGRKMHTALYHTNKRPNRQDRTDWYLENGAVYFVLTSALQQTCSRVGVSPGLYVMPKERSFEIDDQTDFDICEMLAQKVAV